MVVRTEPESFATMTDLDGRVRFYFDERRSVLPYLHNLAGEDPRAVEARIAGYAKQLPFPSGARHVPEGEWPRLDGAPARREPSRAAP